MRAFGVFPSGASSLLGFPLPVVLLGEVIYHLQRRGRALAATLRVVKNLVFPV